MPIELNCAGCGQLLRVADEHAGKKARCPACGTIADVPQVASPAPWVKEPDRPWQETPSFAKGANPFADRPEPEINPYAPPSAPMVRPGQFGRPHRASLVLTFGIIGILCCMPFGIAAWVMGASDLAEIRAGRMDPSGEGTTRVGMILGMVSVGFAVFWLLVNFGLLAVGGMRPL
jgi:phage FluMu protein Com